MSSIHDIQPAKASLIADLVGLINLNSADLLDVQMGTCSHCAGTGATPGGMCDACGGVGVQERYVVNLEKLKSHRFGRLVEGFDIKNGQLVPKLRSKDKAFFMLVKLLGLDKAVVELSAATPFSDTLSESQLADYVNYLKEAVRLGALD